MQSFKLKTLASLEAEHASLTKPVFKQLYIDTLYPYKFGTKVNSAKTAEKLYDAVSYQSLFNTVCW